MKHTSILWLFLLAGYFAKGQTTTIANELPQPVITILKTEPEQPVEGGQVIVYFRFTNKIDNTLNGWIGADLSSGTSAPGKSTIDWPVINLGKNQSIDGAVMVNTTDAGVGKKIRVYFYETQQLREDNKLIKSEPMYVVGEKEINIAALVNFKLNNFTIHHTRARTTDTDWGSLYAVVDDVPVMEPASIFLGNFQDGTYPFKGKDAEDKLLYDVETGPIALVPGQNSSLYIAYTIYNGGAITDHKGFLNGYAEATANPVMFHGPRPGSHAAMDAMRALNPFFNIIGACDGFVVMDTITINTNGIFSNTKGGNKDFSKRYNTEDYASQNGCGNTSDYEVSSSIRRMSNYLNSSDDDPPVFTKITANRTVNFNEKMQAKFRMVYDINWERTETIDRSGTFITVNDADYGYVSEQRYHSPAKISTPRLVILRGSLIYRMDDPKSQSLSVLNNGPLKQITAIVQLIPGITNVEGKIVYDVPEQNTDKPGEDYGHPDTTTQKIITNYYKTFELAGDWRYKLTSSSGAVYTGTVSFQTNGTAVSGNFMVSDKTKTGITGTFSDNVLSFSRDTGLQTIQNSVLNKISDESFSGTYQNRGKYRDSGTIEIFK